MEEIEATAASGTDVSRLVMLFSIPHFLRGIRRMGYFGSGDALSAVLVLSIIEANLRHIARDPVLALRHAAPDNPPPDEIRRPISVRALAASLRIPYDTARRRVAELEARDQCARTAGGVYVPARALQTPESLAALQETLLSTRQFRASLRAAAPEFDPTGGASPIPGLVAPTSPERLAARFAGEYLLRYAERLAETVGDLGRGLILLAIMQANVEPLLADPELARRHSSADNPPPDGLLAPVPVVSVSTDLGLPFETTRRNVHRLIRAGVVRRVRGGVIAPHDFLDREGSRVALAAHLADVQRSYGSMARLGIVFD
ncbi:MAG: hypothetical protein A2882_06225 [Phenylobacterium sp. RIFCSPHIGHO2_01_FULL_70_10]|nr:MAG: hypothetical protein A2882_06225 [Phenylobacterium sp. RIFCSPHIGHO2_01_FULL_70_10]